MSARSLASVLNVLGAAGAVATVAQLVDAGASELGKSTASGPPDRLTFPLLPAIGVLAGALVLSGIARTGRRVVGATGVPVLAASLLAWAAWLVGVVVRGAHAGAFEAFAFASSIFFVGPLFAIVGRIFFAGLDDAAFAAAHVPQRARIAEAKVALASLLLGAAPLAGFALLEPAARWRAVGIFATGIASGVPAVLALGMLALARRAPGPPLEGAALEDAKRLWVLRRTVGARPQAYFLPDAAASTLVTVRSAVCFFSALGTMSPPWRLAPAFAAYLAIGFAVRSWERGLSRALAWTAVVVVALVVGTWMGWLTLPWVVVAAPVVGTAWWEERAHGRDASYARGKPTAFACLLAWCASFFVGPVMGIAGPVTLVGVSVAFLCALAVAFSEHHRHHARALVAELALRGEAPGVLARRVGAIAMVSVDEPGAYREAPTPEHPVRLG